MRVSKEVTNLLKSKHFKPNENDDKNIPVDNILKELSESNYYVIFLQKLFENVSADNPNNSKAFLQNQGILLRSKHIEIQFQNKIIREDNNIQGKSLLKYNLFVTNINSGLIENLWIIYKEPGN